MLSDQPARNKFENELSKNFSVIASPGTGKTTAITHRIANIISHNFSENLKNFLAVTYTEKAANEIKERVMKQVPSRQFTRLNDIFFGTIHSLCARLLRKHSLKIGIKENFEIIENDTKYWKMFTQSEALWESLSEIERQIIPYFAIDKLLDDAHITKLQNYENFQLKPLPQSFLNGIFNFQPSARESTIKTFQDDLKLWVQIGQNCPLPHVPKTQSKAFFEFLKNEGQNFVSWQKNTYRYLVNLCAKCYQSFKVSNNVLGYDDLINLTLKLLCNSEYRKREIGNYRIILDEAQDTDPEQFKILVNLANGDCFDKIFQKKEIPTAQIKNFSFSMVGDPKQAIYSDRADVDFYTFVHDELAKNQLLEPLNFNITMRCDQGIVAFVNDKFLPNFSKFSSEPMQTRLNAGQGKVEIVKTTDNFETLAKILKDKTSPRNREIEHPSEIAILSPRKAWLNEIVDKLKTFPNVPDLQIWTNENIANQPSLIKWTAAILHYLLDPIDNEEFAGILREIFGISTEKIIAYINHGEKNICAEIDEQIAQLRRKIPQLLLPNIVRSIIEHFQLVEQISALEIYPQKKIIEHYHIVMNAAYEIDSKNLGYRALEEKLIQTYKHFSGDINLNENAVQLLTYHKSKGLEWPIVILPFLYRERKLVSADPSELENERRMLFVACTRAKHQLILLDDSATASTANRTNMISSAQLLGII